MKQKSLENLVWDDENPLNEQGIEVDEWIKLDIGDILIGVFVDKYEDNRFNKMKYFFSNVTIIRVKDNQTQHYQKIGMNSSGNLDFTLNNGYSEELFGTPLKIIREQDIPIKGKPNPAHHFKIIKPKVNTQ